VNRTYRVADLTRALEAARDVCTDLQTSSATVALFVLVDDGERSSHYVYVSSEAATDGQWARIVSDLERHGSATNLSFESLRTDRHLAFMGCGSIEEISRGLAAFGNQTGEKVKRQVISALRHCSPES
jgi:hypothetical protein